MRPKLRGGSIGVIGSYFQLPSGCSNDLLVKVYILTFTPVLGLELNTLKVLTVMMLAKE